MGEVVRTLRVTLPAVPSGLPDHARSVLIEADDVADVRRAVSSPLAWVTARRVAVTVRGWRPELPGWSGRLGPLPGLVRHDARFAPDGGATVRLTLAEPAPLHLVLAAVLALLQPSAPMPTPVRGDAASYAAAPPWLPADANVAGFVGPAPDEEIVRPYDLLINGGAPGSGTVPAGVSTIGVSAGGGAFAGGAVVLVDAGTANPRGYRFPGLAAPIGTLRLNGEHWSVDGVAQGRVGEPMTAAQRDAVRTLRAVGFAESEAFAGTAEPLLAAALLAQLAMTGVLVHAPALPPPTADLLAPELVAALAEPLPSTHADDDAVLDWEVRGVRQRRAALRDHSTGFALPGIAAMLPDALRRPSVTALALAGPDEVPRLVAALRRQTYPQVELVLGVPAAAAAEVRALLAADTVQGDGGGVTVVPIGVNPGAALRAVTAQARGSLLTRFDARFEYGPEHVWDLVVARHYAGTEVVGKGAEFVRIEPAAVTVRRRMLCGEQTVASVTMASLLIGRADLDDLGGWGDGGLLARLRGRGGLAYRTHPFGLVRRDPRPLDRHRQAQLDRSGRQWWGNPPAELP